MVTLSRGWKVAMNLPGSAGWEPEVHGGWKPAVNLPRSAGWDHRAENWPSTCQGRQVEDIPLIMDWVNGWKVAMNLPRSAGWGQKAHYGWKPAINLPRLAGWERGHQPAKVGRLSPQKKCGSTCQGRQVYGHFFNLPIVAGVPKCIGVELKWGDKPSKGGQTAWALCPPLPPSRVNPVAYHQAQSQSIKIQFQSDWT